MLTHFVAYYPTAHVTNTGSCSIFLSFFLISAPPCAFEMNFCITVCLSCICVFIFLPVHPYLSLTTLPSLLLATQINPRCSPFPSIFSVSQSSALQEPCCVSYFYVCSRGESQKQKKRNEIPFSDTTICRWKV